MDLLHLGTTGRAKGARLTHGNLLAMTAAYYADVSELGRATRCCTSLAEPRLGLFSLPFLARGAEQVIPPSGHFDAVELLELVAARERSTFFVPPTLLRRLCDTPEWRSARGAGGDGDRRRIAGAPPDLRAGSAALGPRLWNGYGQGETPCTITAMGPAMIADALEAGDDVAGDPSAWPASACACACSARTANSCRRARSARSWSTGRP